MSRKLSTAIGFAVFALSISYMFWLRRSYPDMTDMRFQMTHWLEMIAAFFTLIIGVSMCAWGTRYYDRE